LGLGDNQNIKDSEGKENMIEKGHQCKENPIKDQSYEFYNLFVFAMVITGMVRRKIFRKEVQ
jgi:Ni,Fe-hydrogenase I cytochrome b subunit